MKARRIAWVHLGRSDDALPRKGLFSAAWNMSKCQLSIVAQKLKSGAPGKTFDARAAGASLRIRPGGYLQLSVAAADFGPSPEWPPQRDLKVERTPTTGAWREVRRSFMRRSSAPWSPLERAIRLRLGSAR